MDAIPSMLFLCVLSASVASGCVASSAGRTSVAPSESVAPTAAPATVSADTGGIEGFVTDDEMGPLAGARVAIVELNNQTMTAADGAYSFSHLAPGTYGVIAEKLGYESKAQKAEVAAGQVKKLNLLLVPLVAAGEDRKESYQYAGFLDWAVTTPYVRVASWFLTGTDNNHFTTNLSKGVACLVDALVWDSSAPLTGKELGSRIIVADASKAYNQSRSPVHVRADNEEGKLKKAATHQVEAPWNTLAADNPAQVIYQQKFTLYADVFYGTRPPDDYRAGPPN